MIKLDYSLQTPEERNQLVQQILEDNPDPNPKYLEILADYLVLCMEKQEKKEKKLLTDNRMATVNKREISFEGLVSQLENGEDGIYNLITNNKNTIFQPKITITKKDLEEIPCLKQLKETIEIWEGRLKVTEGKDAFTIKKALIEMRKDQYIIKQAYRRPIIPNKLIRSKHYIPLDEEIIINNGNIEEIKGISFLSPAVCSAILCNYSRLKEEGYSTFEKDLWYIMEDFDKISEKALEDYPLYEKIVILKIDGLQNVDIQKTLENEFGVKYSVEYISSLWRNKIPKLIASVAEDQYLYWYYLNEEKGHYKKCSRCGQIKLATNKYFSKNKTSKDGYYSICKDCRNHKTKTV